MRIIKTKATSVYSKTDLEYGHRKRDCLFSNNCVTFVAVEVALFKGCNSQLGSKIKQDLKIK